MIDFLMTAFFSGLAFVMLGKLRSAMGEGNSDLISYFCLSMQGCIILFWILIIWTRVFGFEL